MNKSAMEPDFSNMYLDWLRENIEQFRINDKTYRMTLPFLDHDNDMIDIYIIDQENETFLITDDGATIDNLQLSGFDVSGSDKRRRLLYSVISAHGVTLTSNSELIIRCSKEDLPLKKHMLAQCMVKVSDLFYLSRSNTQSVFLDDVQNFLDANDVRYLDNICITGKSRLSTHYDFAIGRSRKSAERLIKVVNNMDVNAAKNIIFAWNDTKEMRQHGSILYTFIQNSDRKVSDDAVGALKEYGIRPAMWTERDKFIPELVA